MINNKLSPGDWIKGQIRCPKIRHTCELCNLNIERHESYWDKGRGRRAHTMCVAYIKEDKMDEIEEKVQIFLNILLEEAKKYSLMGLLRGYGLSEWDYGLIEQWFRERGFKL